MGNFGDRPARSPPFYHVGSRVGDVKDMLKATTQVGWTSGSSTANLGPCIRPLSNLECPPPVRTGGQCLQLLLVYDCSFHVSSTVGESNPSVKQIWNDVMVLFKSSCEDMFIDFRGGGRGRESEKETSM